jgi:hypothetical protein
LEFLLEKPAILPHPASFNLNSNYFKNFLAFRSEKSLENVIPQIRSSEIKNYLEQFPKEATIDLILNEEIANKTNFEGPLDYFFLLLKNIKERELGRDAKHTNH